MEQCHELGKAITHCAHLFRRYMDMQLREYEITPVQSHVIMFLQDREGERVTQRDLERELRLKAPSVNGLVERMEEKGLLCRATSKSDARCRLLSLTEKGHCAAERFISAVQQAEGVFARQMSEEELEVFQSLLFRLIGNLESEVTRK